MPKDPCDQRQRIRAALFDLCVDHGFGNVTVEQVLERAEVDHATFERLFDDLEEVFAEVYRVQRDEFVAAVLAGFLSESEWRRRMRAAAWAMLDFLRSDHRRAYFMSCEVHGAGDRARLIRDEAMQGFFALIDQGRQELEDPESLSFYTAETIGSGIYQQFQTAIAEYDFERLEAMIPQMMYTAVLPYLGPEAAREELAIAPPPPRV